MKRLYFITLVGLFFVGKGLIYAQQNLYEWPKVNKESKTWTRWWWMGSAVDKKNITRSLIAFEKAGIGGVEIEPIYGVKGQEKSFIDFLSPYWIEMLDHTLMVADSLQMGVDLTLGTGWPWGGSNVNPDDAAKRLLVRKTNLKKGTKFSQIVSPFNTGSLIIPTTRDIKGIETLQRIPKLIGVYAYDTHENFTDLSTKVINGQLEWTATGSDYELFFVFEDQTRQKVKRAAPGGEGWVFDHFSSQALENYLQHFSNAFNKINGNIRSVFNDSYEVYKADFTPRFFEAFENNRGYDLRPHINRLLDRYNNEISNRIRSDYRETLSDLMIDGFNPVWNKWAQKMDVKTKYQAHGSPGNLIDLYASADIPECETFGSMPYNIDGFRRIEGNVRAGDADIAMIKFSSSAAHLLGKKQVSAESFTWLREHFKTALSQCKPELEDLFLNGINHIFLHGSTYSPESANWPGWKFYASVNFNDNNPIWEDAPALFEYISRSQSLLQQGNHNNDVLVYWPIHDSWAKFNQGNPLVQFAIHRLDTWLSGTPFYKTVHHLIQEGYSIDYISDRFLEKINVENGIIQLPGGNYRSIVVPAAHHMPLKTLKKLVALRTMGASVVFLGTPQSVPGFFDYQKREQELKAFVKEKINKVYSLKEMEIPLKKAGVIKEELAKKGIKFIRREHSGEKIYYLVNHTSKKIEEFVSLGIPEREVMIFDPLTGKIGKAITEHQKEITKVKVSLPSGSSLFLITSHRINKQKWDYYKKSKNSYKIKGDWDFKLIKGGPDTNFSKKTNRLTSWTQWGKKMENFSGTAQYEIKFNRPSEHKGAWLLELGNVRESAKIWLNDKFIGTLWSNPYQLNIKSLKKGENTLRIQVTNTGANRIKAKEARREEWKTFYDINMVGLDYQPFDTSKWELMEAGLLEDPKLIPLEISK